MPRHAPTRLAALLTLAALAFAGAALAESPRPAERAEAALDRHEVRDDRRDLAAISGLASAYDQALARSDAAEIVRIERQIARALRLEVGEERRETGRDARELRGSRREHRDTRQDVAAGTDTRGELRGDRRDRRDDRRDLARQKGEEERVEALAREWARLHADPSAAARARKASILDELVALENQELRRDRRERREDRRERRE